MESERNIMRDVREAHQMTQNEMAAKVGCSLPSVKRLEKDRGLPRNAAVLRNLRALASLVNIEVPAPAKEG